LEHYVTLFDSAFLPQGLALHASMRRHAGAFTLWVLCMDEEVKATLDAMAIPSLKTIRLGDVETQELLAIKGGRNRAEYCWTLTPFTPKIVFDRDPQAQRVTYVDADMYLLKSPAPIFDEFRASGKAVMITDHAYDAEYDASATSGQYCVQFMTFVRGSSEGVRQWWQDRCVEWCFDRIEDGKLGDQKYLDDWPSRFPESVHVLSQIDVLLAPWNARRFPYSRAIAWHFQGFRLLGNNRALLHRGYSVPDIVDQMVYAPYMQELKNILGILDKPIVQNLTKRGFVLRAKYVARNVRKLIRGLGEYQVVRKLLK
jgi:hypothetical protein